MINQHDEHNTVRIFLPPILVILRYFWPCNIPVINKIEKERSTESLDSSYCRTVCIVRATYGMGIDPDKASVGVDRHGSRDGSQSN